MPKIQTRIIIGADRQKSQLLAIRERANGDLVLIEKCSKEIEWGHSGEYIELSERRTSVHVSPNSGGNTIMSHFVYADGQRVTSAAFVKPKNGRLLWPILSSASANLAESRYEVNPRKNDQIVSLGHYAPGSSILIYHIAVSYPKMAPNLLAHANRKTLNFREFSLHIWWSFIPMVSFHQGSAILLATSLPRLDDTPASGPRIDNFCSFTNREFVAIQKRNEETLAKSVLFKQKRFLAGHPLPKETLEFLEICARSRHKKPIYVPPDCPVEDA